MDNIIDNLPKGFRFRNGRYEARKMVKGRKIFVSGTNLEEVKKQFDEKVKTYSNGGGGLYKRDLTLNEWVEEWLELIKRPTVKTSTYYATVSLYNRVFRDEIGRIKVESLTPLDIQQAVNHKSKKVALKSIWAAKGHLKQCLDAAIGYGMITTNPCLAVVVPQGEVKAEEEIYLTEEQENLFLNMEKNGWYFELFQIMFLTGMRIGEIGALTWDDVDFDNKCIHVRKNLSVLYAEGQRHINIVSPKTKESYRTIPFSGNMENIFLSQKKKMKRLKIELDDKWRAVDHEDLVFTTKQGSFCTRYIVHTEIKQKIKEANTIELINAMTEKRKPVEVLPNFHPHSIRHTFATRCAEKGIDMKVCQRIMGHSSINITRSIYEHVSQRRLADELEKLNGNRGLLGTDMTISKYSHT